MSETIEWQQHPNGVLRATHHGLHLEVWEVPELGWSARVCDEQANHLHGFSNLGQVELAQVAAGIYAEGYHAGRMVCDLQYPPSLSGELAAALSDVLELAEDDPRREAGRPENVAIRERARRTLDHYRAQQGNPDPPEEAGPPIELPSTAKALVRHTWTDARARAKLWRDGAWRWSVATDQAPEGHFHTGWHKTEDGAWKAAYKAIWKSDYKTLEKEGKANG